MARRHLQRICLTDRERTLFSLLKECCQQNEQLSKVTLRAAGGWVRDKLLGLQCEDCDIAIDSMNGETFAKHFYSFLKSHHVHASSMGVIHANPARSKHLETATMTVCGCAVDFVNLRKESYAEDSRIPQSMLFGTPLEDASRRDITINSLFYNISSASIENDGDDAGGSAQGVCNETLLASGVEDFCGNGLDDLRDGIIRTPLAPLETLLDDPLRVLRIVRFAARFQFSIEPNLLVALRDRRIVQSFRRKISRERVGIEVEKMLSHPTNALLALSLLHLTCSYMLVFDPGVLDKDAADEFSSNASTGQLYSMVSSHVDVSFNSSSSAIGSTASLQQLTQSMVWSQSRVQEEEKCHADMAIVLDIMRHRLATEQASSEESFDHCRRGYLYYLTCALLPFVGHVLRPAAHNNMDILPSSLVRHALKQSTAVTFEVGRLLNPIFMEEVWMLACAYSSNDFEELEYNFSAEMTAQGLDALRVRLGWMVRRFKSHWSLAMELTAMFKLMKNAADANFSTDAAVCFAKIDRLKQLVQQWQLEDCYEWKPLLSGNDIKILLQCRDGAHLKEKLDVLMAWQFLHPNSTREDALVFFQSVFQS